MMGSLTKFRALSEVPEKWPKAANYRTFSQIFRYAEVDNFVDNLCKSLLSVRRVTFKWLNG